MSGAFRGLALNILGSPSVPRKLGQLVTPAKHVLHLGPFLSSHNPGPLRNGTLVPQWPLFLGTGVPGSPDPNTIRHERHSAFICKTDAEAEIEGGS